MRSFVIDAYGGPQGTDGGVVRFTVHADSIDEAIEDIRGTSGGQHYDRFELVEETGEIDEDIAGIVEERHAGHDKNR